MVKVLILLHANLKHVSLKLGPWDVKISKTQFSDLCTNRQKKLMLEEGGGP